jgi:hypothetical protein
MEKTTMSKTQTAKTTATKPGKPTKTPKGKSQSIYRLIADSRTIADCTTADEATRRATAHANEHGVPVEVNRGKLAGKEFHAEFTEIVIPTVTQPPASEAIPDMPTEPIAPEPQTNPRAKKPKPEPKPRKLSALDAAAKVLAKTGEPMTTKTLIETMTGEGLWASPNGKTPQATLYAAILREIAAKGKQARFRRTLPGHFAFNVDSTRD